uniref:Uncharacterized protein n=1 Tax=Romanomermis culicivorax TaxID=13658 RepID=A0A915IHA5_ROMCU
MVLTNFFGRLDIWVTIPIHVHATKPSLVLFQYFREHYRHSYQEPNPAISHKVATLILQWISRIWAAELRCVDAIQTTHFTLFLYEARGLDNLSWFGQNHHQPYRFMDGLTLTATATLNTNLKPIATTTTTILAMETIPILSMTGMTTVMTTAITHAPAHRTKANATTIDQCHFV